MNIVYLVDFEIPSRSASSVHVMKMCESFVQEGHFVTLICLFGAGFDERTIFDRYDVEPVFTICPLKLPSIKGRSFLFSWLVNRLVKSIKPDLIYSRAILPVWLPSRRFTTMVEAHKPVWEYGKLYAWTFNRIRASRRFRRLIVISEALRKIFAVRYPELPILVAHDAAAEGICKDSSVKLLNTGQTWNAGYVGNIYPGRGIELIIELAKRMSTVAFHIVGGTAEDLSRLGIVGVPGNVFCYGHVAHAGVKCFRSQFDVLLAPYQNDTETIGGSKTKDYMSPLKIFEYMSEKKVIIASDFPVLREVLNDSNALLVKAADIDQWERAIVVSTREEVAGKLAMNAYRDFRLNFTWRARARKVIQ